MANIHINRAGQNLGIYSEDDVRTGLRSGRFVGTDLGWREGMAAWQPLSQFSEFAADIPTATAAAGPEIPPQSTTGPAPAPTTAASAISPAAPLTPRGGLPWDQRASRGLFSAFIETLQMVLSRPAEAFTVMRREGGLGDPLLYALIGGGSGAIVSFLFSMGLQTMGISLGRNSGFGQIAAMGIGSIFFIVLIPIFIVCGLFIGGAIMHLCLMIVGGARHGFETTFRVLAFTQGSTGVLQMVPICGGVIAGVWAIIANCIGLARAHETDTWRAVLAVFLPLIVCCGGGIFLAIMFGMVGALHQHSG